MFFVGFLNNNKPPGTLVDTLFNLLKTKWQNCTQMRNVWRTVLCPPITTIWKPTDFWLRYKVPYINCGVWREFKTEIV